MGGPLELLNDSFGACFDHPYTVALVVVKCRVQVETWCGVRSSTFSVCRKDMCLTWVPGWRNWGIDIVKGPMDLCICQKFWVYLGWPKKVEAYFGLW